MISASKCCKEEIQNDKVLMLAQEKKMALCDICGSFLVANDAVERTQSHVTGKQHIGYGMVRDFIAEFKESKEKAREEERLAREKEAKERRKQREKEQEDRRRSNSSDRGLSYVVVVVLHFLEEKKKTEKKQKPNPKKNRTQKNRKKFGPNRNFGLVSVLAKNRTDQNRT
ncbi:hypothetical protein ACFX1T_012976 [Malus domestica]